MPVNYSNAEWNHKKVIIGETELDPCQPIKLLIGFHGADSTPENMLIHGNRLQLENTVMVFPEGPVDAGKGLWSWWKDGPNQKETVVEFLEFTRGIIDRAQDYVQEKISNVQLKTCLWGFSQGGAASLVYALHYPQQLHKVASVCGFLPEMPDNDSPNEKTINILGIYGLYDEVVPSFLAEHALDEIANMGHKTIIKETSQGHELNTDNLQDITEFFNQS
ncbi:MAG: alpha/beta hydrolase [Nitrospinales bacterium]